jgi:hypothetical protein
MNRPVVLRIGNGARPPAEANFADSLFPGFGDVKAVAAAIRVFPKIEFPDCPAGNEFSCIWEWLVAEFARI